MQNTKWRVLDLCHQRRNLAEYEGSLDIPDQLLKELLSVTKELLVLVEELEPIDT